MRPAPAATNIGPRMNPSDPPPRASVTATIATPSTISVSESTRLTALYATYAAFLPTATITRHGASLRT